MASNQEISEGPPHFNTSGCIIKSTRDKGRGVYASRLIPRNTLVEVSPVLLFSKDEYEKYGKHTIIDHYSFKWPDGRLALALGLGSIFNHSHSPNTSYTRDTKLDCIMYTTVHDVQPGEELCIYYGDNLWFSDANAGSSKEDTPDLDDGWGGLTAVAEDEVANGHPEIVNPYAEGPQEEIIPEDDLPFTRFKLPPEEEDPQSIRTVQAWVIDVPEPRHITTLLKWLKQVGLDGPELGHLKRIRKHDATTTLLLSTEPEAPDVPPDLNLPAPYLLPVPTSSALTLPSLTLKSALWPTMYTPRRKDEPEPWTRAKLKWAWDAMKRTFDRAIEAQTENELPIAALIPEPFSIARGEGVQPQISLPPFIASDTRRSTSHPLRHAAINAVRKLADYQASNGQDSDISTPKASLQEKSTESEETSRNGSNYLLTDRTFFITHEPCIMCSMALLHSRVKEVVYLYPMPRTGGCGGCACLPTLKGVNHRFAILQWKFGGKYGHFSEKDLEVDDTIDA
ncbi:hypothetical protein BDN70DRAFT_912372 [Pholiota conissans]|uniref:SET domain-containing protein n=1 Tax=Pholiota conissans TaxID=109636 RepID=A0A9P6CV10_9AGAR|nr:hypothetical protein BDN70DRAFT_912372 [Pholiota conissans]